MRTIWEIVNSDLVEYRSMGFRVGYEYGVTGSNLPPYAHGLDESTLSDLELSALIDGMYQGHTKGIDVYYATSIDGRVAA